MSGTSLDRRCALTWAGSRREIRGRIHARSAAVSSCTLRSAYVLHTGPREPASSCADMAKDSWWLMASRQMLAVAVAVAVAMTMAITLHVAAIRYGCGSWVSAVCAVYCVYPLPQQTATATARTRQAFLITDGAHCSTLC